jgi:hypothetical protein
MLLEQIKVGKPLPEHKDYDEMIRNMVFWENSVEVNKDYYETIDPNGNKVLKKFTCEEEKVDFKFRKSISSPRNYMGGILQKYLSCSFKVSPTRSENEFYDNVDLVGSDMNEFMLHKVWESAVYGASYMMPDSTASDPSLSEAQKRQIGARSFIRSIETENVINWVDYLGHLQEVIVLLEDVQLNQFALWFDNENMCRIELDNRGKVTSIGDVVPHGYSQMPVVRMLPFDTDESFVAAGSLSQMTLNNLLSLEKTELFSNTFTRFFLKGIRTNTDDEQMQKVTWGTNRLIVSDSETAAITPLGADPSQAQSIRDSIKGEEESLYRIYHLVNTQIQAGTAPSGYSIVLSREDFNAICATFTKTAERAENTIAMLLNETESLGLDTVVYSREFIEPSKQEKILEMRDILSLPIPEDMKAQEVENFRKMFYSDSK